MGGLRIEGTSQGRPMVGGRRRTPGGVENLDRETGDWRPALSGWQRKELVKRLRRKRRYSTRLDALRGVEDPDTLDRLERDESPEIAEAVQAHRAKLRAAAGKPEKDRNRGSSASGIG